MINPRHSFYSYEWEADQEAHPQRKATLLLAAARVHRDNASGRIAVADSRRGSHDCPDRRIARDAIKWALIAVARARRCRMQMAASPSVAPARGAPKRSFTPSTVEAAKAKAERHPGFQRREA